VIPWKLLIGFLVVAAVLCIGAFTVFKKTLHLFKKPKANKKQDDDSKD
jgi:F0F1-type ATP synthase assembly protein I